MGEVVLPGAIVLVTSLSGADEGEIRDVDAKWTVWGLLFQSQNTTSLFYSLSAWVLSHKMGWVGVTGTENPSMKNNSLTYKTRQLQLHDTRHENKVYTLPHCRSQLHAGHNSLQLYLQIPFRVWSLPVIHSTYRWGNSMHLVIWIYRSICST